MIAQFLALATIPLSLLLFTAAEKWCGPGEQGRRWWM